MIHPTGYNPENYPHKIEPAWFSIGKTYASMVYDLKKVFNSHRDYLSINWHGNTEGDHTHYGMSLFTKRKEVHDLALGLERLKPIIQQ